MLRNTFLFVVFDELIIRNDLQKHHNPARFSCLNIPGHTKSQSELGLGQEGQAWFYYRAGAKG